MAINEIIVTGRKFRKLIDETNKLWQRISIWTKASDVEFDDGSNAETKFGAINGVTDSLTSTSSNVAASAAAVKALNDKITELSSNLSSDLVVSNMTNASSFDVTFPKLPETVYACAVYSVGGALMYFWEYNCATGITRYKYSDSMNEWRPSTNSPLTVNGNTVTYKKIGADFGAAIVFG